MGAQGHAHVGEDHEACRRLEPVRNVVKEDLEQHAQDHGCPVSEAVLGGDCPLVKSCQQKEGQHDGGLGQERFQEGKDKGQLDAFFVLPGYGKDAFH